MAKRAFSAEDVWSLRSVADPQLSPDGEQIAWVVGTPDRDTDRMATAIWVAPSDGSSPGRPFSGGPDDTSPRWSPDGSRLAFVSDRGSGPQLVVASLAGGEPQVLTTAPSGVRSPAWSPDGARLVYAASTGEWTEPAEREPIEANKPIVLTGLRNRFDAIGWFDARRRHVFVVDAAGGEGRQVTEGDWDDGDPSWTPDGRSLLFVSDRSRTRHDADHADVWLVAATGRGRPRRLTRGLGTAAGPLASPDGAWVAYVGHEHDDGDSASNTHLLVVPTAGGEAPRSLSAELDRPVFGALRPIGTTHAWSADGATVDLLVGDSGAQGIYRAPLAGGLPRLLVGGDRQLAALTAAAGRLGFVSSWPSAPPEVSCTDAEGNDERVISAANAEVRAQVRLATVRRRAHRSEDGTRIDSFVLRPAASSKGPHPLVLEIHGGPHGWHPQGSMLGLYQALAGAGYVVVLPNPRGSHSYGEDFSRACTGDWGGADFADLMGVVDDLVADGTADPERLYVAGYSYGGFMTTWTVGHTDRFRAACISAPVADLTSMWGTTDIPFFNEHEIGGTPWEAPAAYAERSPLTYLRNVTTPVQLLHWDGDLRCPVSQSDEVFQTLRRLGREVVLVRYPGGFHVVRTPSQMVDFVERHLGWFADH